MNTNNFPSLDYYLKGDYQDLSAEHGIVKVEFPIYVRGGIIFSNERAIAHPSLLTNTPDEKCMIQLLDYSSGKYPTNVLWIAYSKNPSLEGEFHGTRIESHEVVPFLWDYKAFDEKFSSAAKICEPQLLKFTISRI